ADEVEAHDRGRPDNPYCRILVVERRPLVVRLGDSIEELRLVVELTQRMTIAQLVCQERGEPFGIAGFLCHAESLDIFQNRIFVGACKSGDGNKQSKRKRRQDQTATIDVHDVLPILWLWGQSLSRIRVCRAGDRVSAK